MSILDGSEYRPASLATELPAAEVTGRKKGLIGRMKSHPHLLSDIASVYGVQMASYIFPLMTVPYLSRVLGPEMWGLVAMALAFGTYGHLIVEYGFIYSASRELAGVDDRSKIEEIIAGVTGAKAILSVIVIVLACAANFSIPLFYRHPLLLWAAVVSELLMAALPNYFFYGMQRVATGSLLDISARAASVLGIFFLVRRPEDAWLYFALQAAGSFVALIIGHWMIYSQFSLRAPRLREAVRMLKEGGAMFLFRSSHSMFTLGNAFVLGLFAPAQAVGYYAGAEKINAAAVGLLSPLSTALYPRTASMAKIDLVKAARLTRISPLVMMAVSLVLGLVMWLAAPLVERIILGPQFGPSGAVLQILALRAPLVAWTYVIGFQWLLVLGLERPFQKVTIAALIINILLATCLAPRFTYIGMAWAVVLSQLLAAFGIYWLLKRRNLSPFTMRSSSAYV
jgi:PST family polysaccharide transporter